MRIAEECLELVLAHAATDAARGEEACGLLMAREDTIWSAVPCENVASRPAHDYRIDTGVIAREVVEAVRLGLRLVGGYHSHPSGAAALSLTDLAHSPHHDWLHLVIGADASWAAYRVPEYRPGADRVEVEVHRLGDLRR